MTLAEKLKKARTSLSKTQRDMAKTVGKSFRVWQQYEEGKTIPGGNVFKALADMGFNAHWFFADDVPMMASGLATPQSAAQQTGEERRILPHGRRGTDQPMSPQARQLVEQLLYLEREDQTGFIFVGGKIVERYEQARENEELKKIGTEDA